MSNERKIRQSPVALVLTMILPIVLLAAQQSQDPQKLRNRTLRWDPPQVDTRLSSWGDAQGCSLSSVLNQAGARANELATNLQNFTAQEKIEYASLGMTDNLKSKQGSFNYTAVFEPGPEGLAIQESRVPRPGTPAFPAGTLDIGLSAMALIFLTASQGDYEMNCEGTAEWNRQPTWIVHFRQRADEPRRTASFTDKGSVYPAKLKGRAWITQDSGQVVHLETSLMEPIAEVGVRRWYLSLYYAPVRFRTQNVRVWLPQAADAYCDFGDHRTIIYHTFTNFLLFSVETDQVIDKPKDR